MYSVMLMMAMTTGGDLQSLGHHGCCGGYSSCCGGYEVSCCGGSCCGGRHRLFGGRRHSCCGGYDACGCAPVVSCCGGGYVGCGGGYVGCSGSYVGCSGGVIYGGAPAMAPATVTAPATGPAPEPVGKPKETTTPPKESLVPAPATIIVSLPADAKLSIDDAATVSTTSTRVFTSPVLPAGEDFHYTLKAEFSRAGQPVVLSKEITVRAGAETRVDMDASVAGVASR